MIHETAIVIEGAQVARDAEVGPYVVIEKETRIASGTKIMAHAYICSGTEIGEGSQIHVGCVLGGIPQDITFKEVRSFLKIGKGNVFREYCTVHRGVKEGSSTVIGDENYLMTYAHIGHNCRIGNKNVIATGAMLAGYVTVEDGAFVSGNAAVHQFANVGRLAMIGGNSRVNKDVPPYMLVRGDSAVYSPNVVGLKRSNLSESAKKEIKEAYKLLYRSNLNTSQALERLEKFSSPEVKHLINFITSSKRGICPGPRG